jgi:DNA-directed RNA polymerase sigma subunit (sigma70/sigma32)
MSARGHEPSHGVRGVVRFYAQRNNWIDIRDLTQEAAVAQLEASQQSAEQWGPRAAALALSRFVAETRAPVSLPKRKGDEWREASASHRAELDDVGVDGESVDQWEPIEHRLDRERAYEQIRRLLAEECEAARLVLLSEEKPATVAERLGVSVQRVYDQTEYAMRRLRTAFAPMIERAA